MVWCSERLMRRLDKLEEEEEKFKIKSPKVSQADIYKFAAWSAKLHGEDKMIDFRTQKAKGVVAAASMFLPGTKIGYDAIHVMPQAVGDVKFPCFARPCPIRPRHGFIDSRLVYTWGDAIRLYDRVQQEELGAELILMPYIDADCSAVAHNGGISWGLDNDGATADKGSVFIPASVSVETWHDLMRHVIATGDMTFSELSVQDCGYLELVAARGGESYAVQVRDGPAQTAELDFLPEKKVKVTEVLTSGYRDLLEWEALIKSKAGQQGVVVNNFGGTLSSHYSVHAITAGIPVICTRSVKVGETLRANSNKRAGLSQQSLEAIAGDMVRWMQKGHFYSDNNFFRNRLLTAVATIHGQHGWDDTEPMNRLRGFAPPILFRHLVAACVGEMRHWYPHGPGRFDRNIRDPLLADVLKLHSPRDYRPDRDVVYDGALKEHNIDTLIALSQACEDGFSSGWHQHINRNRVTGGGYGGPAWLRVAKATSELGCSLKAFVENNSKDNWKRVVMAANSAIHQAHNGGKTLEKFGVYDHDLTNIERCPTYGLFSAFSGRLVLGLTGPST